MNALRTFMLRAGLALLLACGGASALAGPMHFVSLDTSALAGRSGYLDFLFLGLQNASPAQARVSQLAGNFGADSFTLGDAAGDAASGLVLDNGGNWSEAGLWANFGGTFRFAVEFDLTAGAGAGTTLTVALLDASLAYLPGTGDVARFALQPGEAIAFETDPAIARVSLQPLPEAPTMWLFATGMLMLADRMRRRRAAYVPPIVETS